MEQVSGSFMAGISAFFAHLPLTLSWPSTALRFFVYFHVKPVSLTFWIMLNISTMVVLSAPFNPSPMCLPLPLAVLYLTHSAVTKVTRRREIRARAE